MPLHRDTGGIEFLLFTIKLKMPTPCSTRLLAPLLMGQRRAPNCFVAPRAGGEGGELRVLVGCSSCCGCWCWASPGALLGALLAAWLSGCWLLWWVGCCSCGYTLEHRMTHWISERTRIRRITDYVCTRLVSKSPVQGVTYKQLFKNLAVRFQGPSNS